MLLGVAVFCLGGIAVDRVVDSVTTLIYVVGESVICITTPMGGWTCDCISGWLSDQSAG